MEASLPNGMLYFFEDGAVPDSLLATCDTAIVDTSAISNRQFSVAVEYGAAMLKPGGILFIIAEQNKHHDYVVEVEDRGLDIKDSLLVIQNEPLMVTIAMKPYDKTFFNNALKHGVAGFWIDGNRVGNKKSGWNGLTAKGNSWNKENCGLRKTGVPTSTIGKFVSNLAFVDSVADGDMREYFHVLPTADKKTLLEYLCRLSKTPSGGMVVDLATTDKHVYLAAINSCRDFIGISMNDASLDKIAKDILSLTGSSKERIYPAPRCGHF